MQIRSRDISIIQKLVDLNLKNDLPEFSFFNRQVILFILIGGLCYLIGLGQLILFVEWLKIEVNLANAIASVITIFICYLLNVKYVFKGGKYSKGKEILAFYVFSFAGLLLNVTLMYLMTKYLFIWYVVAKTLVTLVVAVFNFLTRKKIVFLQ